MLNRVLETKKTKIKKLEQTTGTTRPVHTAENKNFSQTKN